MTRRTTPAAGAAPAVPRSTASRGGAVPLNGRPLDVPAAELSVPERLRRAAEQLDRLDAADVNPEVVRHARSSDDPVAIARLVVDRFLAALDTGDLSRLEEFLQPDVAYVVPGRSRASGIYEGCDGVRRALAISPREGVTTLRSERTDTVAAPARVITLHELSGVADGRPVRFGIALGFTIRDGRISAVIEYSGDQYTSDDLFGHDVLRSDR